MPDLYHDHAWLYDLAFSWDTSAEVDWLMERFGPDVKSVLEPACGSGRMLLPLAQRGLRVAGIDGSPAMLESARARFREAGTPEPRMEVAGLADFDLAEQFDAALCPISTFGYVLTDEDAARHLERVAAHLAPGARYLVQMELRSLDPFELSEAGPTSSWTTGNSRCRLQCSVFGRRWDAARRVETMVTRFEILSGADEGRVIEDETDMQVWDWRSWQALIESSPFHEVTAYDGNARGRPPLEVGKSLEGRPLVWHALQL